MGRARFSGVVFDLDGTLLDSLADLAQAMNSVLTAMGFPSWPVPDYRYFVGDGIETLARRVLPPGSGPECVAACVAGMRREYGCRWKELSQPYPGIEEMLTGLAARGVRLAILSNKPEEFTRETVAYFFAGHPFAQVVGARAGQPLKPDPGGALQIAGSLGLAPGAILYLGDTATDMRTAVGAGMYPAGALWGFRPEAELVASGARLTLAHPRQLLTAVDFGDQ